MQGPNMSPSILHVGECFFTHHTFNAGVRHINKGFNHAWNIEKLMLCREADIRKTVKLEAISDDIILFLMHSSHVNTQSIFRPNSFFTQATRVTENIGKVNSLYMVSHIIARSKSKLFTDLAKIFLLSWIIRNILI